MSNQFNVGDKVVYNLLEDSDIGIVAKVIDNEFLWIEWGDSACWTFESSYMLVHLKPIES